MKGTTTWTYHPYRPYLTEVGDIYICRIVPGENSIHFEWLPTDETCSVFYREQGAGEYIHLCDTADSFCDIENLCPDTDYEFYVTAGEKRSRVRLARCGKSVGTVVNYLHPDD